MRRPLPLLEVLRPILDTYKDAAVAVVGCNATGIQREKCELDVVLVSEEVSPPVSLRTGVTYCDLFFVNEKEALQPTDPEIALSLAQAKPVRDTSLVLSTSTAAAMAVLGENSKRASQSRLASCLKVLGRAEDAISQDRVQDANYWLLAASFDFAYSWLYAREMLPSPSHLLGQLKEQSKGNARNFEAFAAAAGLEQASRKACTQRLDALYLLYDIMKSRQSGAYESGGAISDVGFQIVKGKAEELNGLNDHAECYSFLGKRVADLLDAVARVSLPAGGSPARGYPLLSSLADEKQGLLSRTLIGELGLERGKRDIEKSLEMMKEQVAKLARRI